MKKQAYAAIRKGENGDYYIDNATISDSYQLAEWKAKAIDNKIPNWAAANPIIKIAGIIIKTVYPIYE